MFEDQWLECRGTTAGSSLGRHKPIALCLFRFFLSTALVTYSPLLDRPILHYGAPWRNFGLDNLLCPNNIDGLSLLISHRSLSNPPGVSRMQCSVTLLNLPWSSIRAEVQGTERRARTAFKKGYRLEIPGNLSSANSPFSERGATKSQDANWMAILIVGRDPGWVERGS